MRLPHGPFLSFAKEVIYCEGNTIQVHCIFNSCPSLAIFIEAAAQCTAGFEKTEKIKMGFLAQAKKIALLGSLDEKEYLFTLTQEIQLHQFRQFTFEANAFDSKVKVVTGAFTLHVVEEMGA